MKRPTHVNLSWNFAPFSFSERLWEVSSLAGNFFWATEMDFLNFFCCVSGFDRKTKRCLRILAIFLFFCQSLKHCRKNSKSPSPWPRWPLKNFPPKRTLLRDAQKMKKVQNLKMNWPALVPWALIASSSHNIQKTFWNFSENFRNLKILYKNVFIFKGLQF